MAQGVKNPPAMQETQEMRVQPLSWEDSLEEGMEIHFRVLAWEIPWTEEPGGLWSIGLQRVRYAEATEHIHTHPLQNPRIFSVGFNDF